MVRYRCRRHFTDVTVGHETEVLEVEVSKVGLPLGGEDAGAAELRKSYVEPSKASKQVYELEVFLHANPRTLSRNRRQLVQKCSCLACTGVQAKHTAHS